MRGWWLVALAGATAVAGGCSVGSTVTVAPTTATSAESAVTVPATTATASTASTAASTSSEDVLSVVDALATAVEHHATDGFNEQLSLEELMRLSPRMPLLETLSGDAAGVELMQPLGNGCAVVRASGVAMTVAQVPRACGPDTVVPVDSIDAPWLAVARARIEQIPQHIADRIKQAAFTMLLQHGQQLSAETFASVFHELTFVEEAIAPGEVSLLATGTHLAVALRSSTNHCYVMRSEITTDSVTGYGTADVCTATEADRTATNPKWPAG